MFDFRLTHLHTLTRSTTPSGSEMGKVFPTFLMSPPTTCRSFDTFEQDINEHQYIRSCNQTQK